MCHDNQSCEDCHVATIGVTESNTINDFYQPYYPGNSVDGAKNQAINRVHELKLSIHSRNGFKRKNI